MSGKPSVFKRIKQFFARVTDAVYGAVAKSPIGRFLGAYPVSERLFRASGTVYLGTLGSNPKRTRPLRRGMARAMDQSLLRRGCYRLINAICRCSLRTVGALLVTMGTYAAIISWVIASLWRGGATDAFHIYAAVALLAVGVLLLFSEQSVGYALSKGVICSLVLRELMGFSEDTLKDMPKTGREEFAFAVPIGMAVGTLMAIVGPLRLLLVAALLLVALMMFTTPESGVVLLVLFTPFAGLVPYGSLWLALGVLIPFLGYFFKLLRGTRAFHLELQDFVVLAMLVLTLFGIVSAGGSEVSAQAVGAAILMALYFPAVNVLATPQWLLRCRLALLASATAASLLAIMQFIIFTVISAQGSGTVTMLGLSEAVRAGFADRTTFAYFAVLAFPFALHAFVRAKPKYRILTGFSCVTLVLAAVLSFVQSAWIAMLAELLVTCLLCAKYTFPYLTLAGMASPGVIALLPREWRARLAEAFVHSGDISGTRTGVAADISKRLFFENGSGFFSLGQGLSRFAFGLGQGGLEAVCVLYTKTPVAEATQSFNFFLYRLAEGGLLGVLLPVLLLFLLLQNCFSLLREGVRDKHGPIQPLVGVALVFGVVAIGIFRYSWYDPAALLAFIIAISLVGADARYRRAKQNYAMYAESSDTAVELDYRIVKAPLAKSEQLPEQNGETGLPPEVAAESPESVQTESPLLDKPFDAAEAEAEFEQILNLFRRESAAIQNSERTVDESEAQAADSPDTEDTPTEESGEGDLSDPATEAVQEVQEEDTPTVSQQSNETIGDEEVDV